MRWAFNHSFALRQLISALAIEIHPIPTGGRYAKNSAEATTAEAEKHKQHLPRKFIEQQL
ncbi:MAG TPA: hypothetical protein VKA92_11585 [Segetibacter sp.]|nr:hypothetical protein [Segetibacter sp.]